MGNTTSSTILSGLPDENKYPCCATSDRELIIFRDSFGSSIAPLMLEGYAKITLVDLRYISTRLLGDYIDFSRDQDVLFLYTTQVLNNSLMLR